MKQKRFDKDDKLKLIDEVGFKKHFTANNWAEYNKQFFDKLASKYDATNKLSSLGTKAKLNRLAVDKLNLQPGMKVLDLCAGSGDISIEMAQRYPSVEIVALDASQEMLAIAQEKGSKYSQISYQQGDALALPFADQSFDAVIISFGLRNLDNPISGLKEMKRVLKPNGIMSSIDQGKPNNILFRGIYWFYFQTLLPVLGKIIFHRNEFNSLKYLPRSNRYFPSQREWLKIWENELGLKNTNNYDYWCGAVSQQVAYR